MSNDTFQAVFLNVQRFDFQDESTGRTIQGAKIRASLPAIEDQQDLFGFIVTEARIDFSLYEQIKSASRDYVGKLVNLHTKQFATRRGFELRVVGLSPIGK
jgi:hypothetical protein